MDRTKREDLDRLVNLINDYTAEQIVLDHSYGGYKIEKQLDHGTSRIWNLDLRLTTRECELVLRGMLAIVEGDLK